ncbi:uncharacterized protein [Miscanthus floridulus]|uniref:uncharacterized protein isoform X2 n=1 Tax=Miscanthus floridulus TaxID=154761 RepID=UPI00345B3AE8
MRRGQRINPVGPAAASSTRPARRRRRDGDRPSAALRRRGHRSRHGPLGHGAAACWSGDAATELMLCDWCDRGFHIFCRASPPATGERGGSGTSAWSARARHDGHHRQLQRRRWLAPSPSRASVRLPQSPSVRLPRRLKPEGCLRDAIFQIKRMQGMNCSLLGDLVPCPFQVVAWTRRMPWTSLIAGCQRTSHICSDPL